MIKTNNHVLKQSGKYMKLTHVV